MRIVCFSCPQSLCQHFCLDSQVWSPIEQSVQVRRCGSGSRPWNPWLCLELYHPEQELVSGRNSFAANGWFFVSVGSFEILLPTLALVLAASPVIPNLISFGTLWHGYWLLRLIKWCITWQMASLQGQYKPTESRYCLVHLCPWGLAVCFLPNKSVLGSAEWLLDRK